MEDPVHDLIPKTSKAITEFDLLQRKEWAKARADALAKWEKVHGALETAEKAALENLEIAQRKAREMVSAAMEAWQDISAKRQRAQQQRDGVVAPAEAELRATASPRIRDLVDRLERRRRNLDVRNEYEWDRQNGGDRAVATNAESVKEVALHIARILQQDIRELELAPLSEIELDKKIAEIEADIPEPEMRPIR